MPRLTLNETTLLKLFSYSLQAYIVLASQITLLRRNFSLKDPIATGFVPFDYMTNDLALILTAALIGVVLVMVALGIYFSKAADKRIIDENSEMSWEYILAAFGMVCLETLRWMADLIPLCIMLCCFQISCGVSQRCTLSGGIYAVLALEIVVGLCEYWLVMVALQNYTDRKDLSMCGNSFFH
jgi:hypothetical protein